MDVALVLTIFDLEELSAKFEGEASATMLPKGLS